MSRRPIIALLFILVFLGTVHSADLTIPNFELISWGSIDPSGTFSVYSRFFSDISLEGGSKFSANLKLGMLAPFLEMPDELALINPLYILDPFIRVTGASATVRELFGAPLQISYFYGRLDRICTGDDFVRLYGAKPFATAFRGPSQYPAGIGGNPYRWYDGLHEVDGTGIRLGAEGLIPWFTPYLYAYQDLRIGDTPELGNFSIDARVLFNFERIKMEAFAGVSFPQSVAGIYRFGALILFDTGSIGEFYAQMGIPEIDFSLSAPLTGDRFFFLFEPRIRLDPVSIIMTVFKHPSVYLLKATDEGGITEYALDIRLGDIARAGMEGGIRSTLKFDDNASMGQDPLTAVIVPYYSLNTNGVVWTFKLGVALYPFTEPVQTMLQPSIGVKTSF